MGRLEKLIRNVSLLMFFQLWSMLTKAEDTTYVQRYDMYIKNLVKTEMRTSVLYNRVFGIAKLHPQQNTDLERSEIKKDYANWKQVYLEMYSADYNNSTKLNYQKYLETRDEYQINSNRIPIGIINYKYDYIDSNAFLDGRIKMINQLPSRNLANSTSPFLQDSVCILSILGNQLYTGYSTFIFDKSFYYSNKKSKPKKISLNFNNDQGEVFLNEGDTLKMLLNSISEVSYTYKIYFDNGTIVQNDAVVNVVSSGTAPCYDRNKIQTINTFIDYNTKNSGAVYEYGVYVNNCFIRKRDEFRKPILIIDGFDPSDSRKIGNIYDLMNESPFRFADSLLEAGHDIVICNFIKGADYIERNALAVIELIQYINNRTADKLIVIGPSMGGLIAKYALAKMEKENIPHNTSLYISFDSPHQGANIPIGDQYFLYFFGEVVGDASALDGLNQIRSSAARQMLTHHQLENSISPKYNRHRKSFLDNCSVNGIVNSNGYPITTRNISVLNGSGVAELQNVNGKLFSLEKKKLGIKVAEAQIYSSPNIGTSKVAYLMAANVNDLLHPFRLTKYASVVPNSPYPMNIDNAPGGYFNTQQIITGLPTGQNNGLFNVINDRHCFIPSTSALDIKFPNEFVNYKFAIQNSNLICEGKTPFDAYYAPSHNEFHVSISSENAAWLKREIRNANKSVEVISQGNTIHSGQVFNYGSKTKNYYSKSFTIEKGGILGVNMNTPTGFNNEPAPILGSKFIVDGYNTCNQQLTISIQEQGKLIVGDPNSNTGEFIVSENSVLLLADNSNLTVHNNSKLIIRKGSKLVVGRNASIELLGNNAQLIIEGELVVNEGAIFAPIGEGYLKVNTNTITLLADAKIELEGADKNDVILVVADASKFTLPYVNNLGNKLSIKNGKVLLEYATSYINTAIPTEFVNVSIVNGNGLITNGQPNVIIQDCEFLNNTTGVTAYSNAIEKFNIVGQPLKIVNTSFLNNQTAVKIYGKSFYFQNISVENCERGIVADGMELESKIINSDFTASENQIGKQSSNAAITYIGDTGAKLDITSSNITKYNTGIYTSQSTLNLLCNTITRANYQGLWIANNAMLNMSPSLGEYAGNNTISVLDKLNNKAVFLEQANTVQFANGVNKLKINSTQNNYFVAGTMVNIPSALNLQKNNWYASISSGAFLNPPSQNNFIVQKNPAPSSPKIGSFIVQPVLGNTLTSACDNNTLPIVDPCAVPGSCIDVQSNDPLVYSKNSKLITIPNYPIAYYNILLKTILNQIKNDETNLQISNNFLALCDLYLSTNKFDSSDVIYLKDLTYTYVMELFNSIYELEKVSNSQLATTHYEKCLLKIKDLIAIRISELQAVNDSIRIFSTHMDLAQLHTKIGNFDLAKSSYNDAINSTEKQSLINLANHWICINNAKELMYTNSIQVEQLDSLFNSCSSLDNSTITAGRNAYLIDTMTTKISQLDVVISPNPAQQVLHVYLLNTDDAIESVQMHTMQNQLVKNIQLDVKATRVDIDLSEIESGVYLVHVKSNRLDRMLKVIVSK